MKDKETIPSLRATLTMIRRQSHLIRILAESNATANVQEIVQATETIAELIEGGMYLIITLGDDDAKA